MNWIKRFIVGLFFAIPLMLMTYALVSAADAPQASGQTTGDCVSCHQDFQNSWMAGSHGQATTDPIFREAWQAAGKPSDCLECHVTGYDRDTKTWEADGVTCVAWHSPIPANHPQEPMPVEHTGKKCGDCHVETYFEWEVSTHRAKGIDCSNCHDPHNTSLVVQNPQELCASCHRERSGNYAHSAHSKQGLTCNSCHMTELKTTGEGGHARVDHSFFVSLKTCNQCHVYDMHDPVNVHPEAAVDQAKEEQPAAPDAMASVESLTVMSGPTSSSPLTLTILAGVLGIVIGMMIAPLSERINRRNIGKDS